MQAITPLSRSEFDRVIRATYPVAGSYADAEECALDAQLQVLTKEVDNPGDVGGLVARISRDNALKRRRQRRVHPLQSLDAIEAHDRGDVFRDHEPIRRAADWRTFYLWPGSDVHIDLLAIAEDHDERHRLALAIAALQDRAESADYIGLHRSFREWDRESVLDALREFGEHKGSTPTHADLNRHESLPSISTIYRFFRQWETALRAAGFEPHKASRSFSRWDRETARAAFCAWVTRHGRIPGRHELQVEQADLPSLTTLRRLFGTGGALRLSVEINRLCLDAGCAHTWRPGTPHAAARHSL
ncbi:MAG TPA: hypothetical protein VK756_07860 [Solirubrobacteraceae bacterium]|nr:hypothetical protein [Solirubrobacteraceae bacterium]